MEKHPTYCSSGPLHLLFFPWDCVHTAIYLLSAAEQFVFQRPDWKNFLLVPPQGFCTCVFIPPEFSHLFILTAEQGNIYVREKH